MECHPPSPLPSRCVFLPSHLAIIPPRRYLARITLPRPFLPATQPPTLSADGLENTDAGVQHAVGAVHEAKVWPRDRHVHVQQGQVPEGRREEGAGGGGSRGKGDARGLKTQVISTVHSRDTRSEVTALPHPLQAWPMTYGLSSGQASAARRITLPREWPTKERAVRGRRVEPAWGLRNSATSCARRCPMSWRLSPVPS